MFGKNFILFGLLILTLVSGFLLIFIRYSSQSILLSNFDLSRNSNLITILLFALYVFLIVINIISGAEYRRGGLVFLLCCSVIGLAALLSFNNFEEKENKIIVSAIFVVMNLYILVCLVLLATSRSKKLHPFSGFWLIILIIIVCLSATFYNVYYFKDDSASYSNGFRKADAGVVLGAAVWGGNRPSPILRERINKAFEIYEKKYAPKIVLTGGGAPNELSEGDVSKNELIKYGVDKGSLIVEDKSNSTFEQIMYVRDNLYRKNNWTRIILVSDNYHLFRSSEICKFNNMNVDCFSTDTPHTPEGALSFCLKETIAVIFYWIFGIG